MNDYATILNFVLGYGRYTLFTYSWPGSRPVSSVWNGLHYVVRNLPFSTASLSDVDCTVDFDIETSQGDRFAVIATAPLDPWMGYVWEVEEDDDAADKNVNGTKKRKMKRKKNISADSMERPIMRGSLYKDISNGDDNHDDNDDQNYDKEKDNGGF